MAQISAKYFRFWMFISLLLLTALACNAPVGQPTEMSIPTEPNIGPENPQTLQPTLSAPETIPAIQPTATFDAVQDSPTATFTPIAQPTLIPTRTPSPTRIIPTRADNSGQATVTPTRSSGDVDSSGPLAVEYHISWRFKEGDPLKSIASVTIMAKGGGGGYTYYRDGFLVAGPQFEYEWSSCSGNPGTLTVTSADGQSRDIPYYSEPPCPTPEP